MLLVAAFCGMPVAAQSPARPANTENRSASLNDNVAEPEKARDRSASEKREREFIARLAEFAKAWNELIKLSEKGVWNPKQAKAAHQAFDRLVSSQAWFEGSKKTETAEK
jgi:hypothetical protein